MTANPHRGEVEVELGGKTVLLRPSFAALVEIERRLGLGLVPLAQRLKAMEVGAGTVATILHACWVGAPKPEYEQVGEMVIARGLVELIPPVIDLIGNALTGGAKNAAGPGNPGPAEIAGTPGATS